MSLHRSELENKANRVKAILFGLGKVGVAFSGGVDSTLLLRLAVDACGSRNVLALTARSATLPERELAAARETARQLGVEHLEVETGELDDPGFRSNSPDRCYYCKRHRLHELRRAAAARGFGQLVEGTNLDDLADYRPGLRASEEAGVRSPLLEAGLSKAEIRELSHRLTLEGWDRPAAACLASRLPYGTEITLERLRQVERAEEFLADLGFSPVRVRHHGDVARIEVAPAERGRLLERSAEVRAFLEGLGFRFVALDLAGYRTGSLNRVLVRPAEGPNPGGAGRAS
ncbi:MAG: ATP-dependent sacrificial sulfur transferase LarE [Bacillota bacterium]|nr:ATP-dependent sacrificial sulfur transferase LarE [Bacillota bacterium]